MPEESIRLIHIAVAEVCRLLRKRCLRKRGDADVWLVRYNQLNEKTLKELATDAPENSRFKAFKEGNVFGCNTRFVDFYEETPFHPERLLEDMIRILHPELEEMTPGHGYYENELILLWQN